MSQPVQADWGLIQQLYMQGFTPKVISEKTGVKADVVSVRANRGKWRELATRTMEAVKGQTEPAKTESASESKISASSERSRAGLARLLERSVERIETMTLKSPKHALKVNQELESVVRNAKTVFGWTENQQAPAIRIGVLAQVTIGPAPAPSQVPESGPVIDVEATQGVTSGDTIEQS